MLYKIALYSYSLTENSTLNIPPILSSPPLTPMQIFNIEILNSLYNFKTHFMQSTNLLFYTDGSLINLGTSSIYMGVAWLQSNSSAPLLSLMLLLSFPNLYLH